LIAVSLPPKSPTELQHGFLGRRGFLDLFLIVVVSAVSRGQEKGAQRQQDRSDGQAPEPYFCMGDSVEGRFTALPVHHKTLPVDQRQRAMSLFGARASRPPDAASASALQRETLPTVLSHWANGCVSSEDSRRRGTEGRRSSFMACTSFALGARPVIIENELLEGRAVVVRAVPPVRSRYGEADARIKAKSFTRRARADPPPANHRPRDRPKPTRF